MEANKVRVRRSVAEKRRIVELTLQPGQSVSRVALAEGVNSHQVFDWRRAYCSGKLEMPGGRSTTLLPVILSATGTGIVDIHRDGMQKATAAPVAAGQFAANGAIHIELPGRATISVESGANAVTLQAVLESLRK